MVQDFLNLTWHISYYHTERCHGQLMLSKMSMTLKETWKLAVHILDIWSVVNSKGNEHLEMVTMDSKVTISLLIFIFNVIFFQQN